MRPLSQKETHWLIDELLGSTGKEVRELIRLSANFASSTDPALRSLSQSLSLRQMIRMAKRFHAYPNFNLHTAVYKACLAKFLPPIAKQVLDDSLYNAGINPPANEYATNAKCGVDNGILTIGETQNKINTVVSNSSKIPETLFFDIKQHVSVLENMLQDWLLGDHLLLIGNQGVGKNKLADRFLYLLNRPREYIQLHRDTTVQSLTIQPIVSEGRIRYEDSPLVLAAKTGTVLVIDEADKAPTQVTCVLKTLVECGEMLLSDGRRIIPSTHPLAASSSPDVIVSHPDFRMIVLANRPGFPFLGNDFFGALGDLFSCHSIDNPSPESELALLKNYGPDVPQNILKTLVGAFGELRDLADQGLMQYPYSTREVVQIVKHMQAYPNDALANVVKNVFDFDSWSGEAKKTLVKTLHKHGIPVDVAATNINVAKRIPLIDPLIVGSWQIMRKCDGGKQVTQLSVDIEPLKIKGPIRSEMYTHRVEPSETRSAVFSEQQSLWQLPLYETALATGVSSSKYSKEIFVASINPLSILSLNPVETPATANYFLLHHLVPSRRGLLTPKTSVAALPNGMVALHEELSNQLLLVNFEAQEIFAVHLDSMFKSVTSSFRSITDPEVRTFFRMNKSLASEGKVVFWEHGGSKIKMLDTLANEIHSVKVPHAISNLHILSPKEWIVIDDQLNKWLLKSDDNHMPSTLHPISENGQEKVPILSVSPEISNYVLSASLNQKIDAPSHIIVPENDHAAIAIGFPQLDSSENEIYVWRNKSLTKSYLPKSIDPSATVAILPNTGQIVRVKDKPPFELEKEVARLHNASYIEITDLVNNSIAYVPTLRGSSNPTWNFFAREHAAALMVSSYGEEGIVTVDAAGGVRIWDIGSTKLESAYNEWRKLIGKDEGPLRLEIKTDKEKEITGPKHGKIDPKNAPHVGGNMWAGGTGGSSTAGLGGIGGPYRLDAGHDVHQVTQAIKDAVPEHVRKAAAAMAKKAFEERLREIRMSSYDSDMYENLADTVRPQIKSLRNIISALQAKNKERQWLRHRTEGEIDDMKLIEGLAGEKNIFRQRREEEPEIGAPQTKPKRLRLVVDVSGSMYRFNGHDGRLEREVEAVLMVMEAFEGFETKFKYELIGHSGETADEVIVPLDRPPKNNKERLDVLKVMQAHSQFCLSGDNTLEAVKSSIRKLQHVEADECFVVLLSDANLDRYGISPKSLSQILTSGDPVQAYCIFIGSLGNQADVLAKSLPAGHGFVCMDLAKLPQILQQIFTSAMIK